MSDVDPSITNWIGQLKQGDGEAARQIWERYFERLVRVSHRQLRNAPRRTRDEEDVAVSVFDTLCRGAAQGRFEKLSDRDDLWRLLVAISGNKVVDQIRRQVSQKRGGGNVRGDSIVAPPGQDAVGGFEQFMNHEPTPELMVMLEEQHAQLMQMLRDDTQRDIARLRLEGYANEEIASQLGISVRSVERKLKLIRETWGANLEE